MRDLQSQPLKRLLVLVMAGAAAAAMVAGCGSDAADATPPATISGADAGGGGSVDSGGGGKPDAAASDAGPQAIYTIGGTITGLKGTGLVLQNGTDTVTVGANATSFVFPMKVAAGASFSVTVKTQPSGPTQSCQVTGGTGTVVAGNVTSVAVNCTTSAFTVGGTTSGLAGSGLVLTNASGGTNTDLPINANGTFAFPAPLPSGQTYAVTVKTQPSSPTQTCAVANGSGTVGGANVTNITVTCTTNKYTVGGAVSGLAGTGLVLQNNLGDDLPIAADGNFTFAASVASGAPYSVTVKTQPSAPYQSCTVTNGSGTIAAANVTDVAVSCKNGVFVDVTNGSNTNTGGAADPYKTITYAIANAPAGPVDIHVAPGTYNAAAGETFPIRPKSGQNLIGDIANKGMGAVETLISGQANCPPVTGGDLNGGSYSFAVYFDAALTNAALRGFHVAVSAGEGIGFDNAQVELEGVTLTGSSDVAFIDMNGSDVSVTNSDLRNGNWTVLVMDAATKLRVRGTSITQANNRAVVLGYSGTWTGSNVDLGTAASPGGNTIIGGTSVGLLIQRPTSSVVNAAGNTWRPNVQGADAAGNYAATLIDGNVAVAESNGNNYAIVATGAGSGIQF